MNITIKQISSDDFNSGLQNQIDALFKQLSPDKKTLNILSIFNDSPQTIVIGAFDKEQLIGMACMATYLVISSKKAWVEDVVVDSRYRGMGLGKKLMTELIHQAKSKNCTDLMLYTEAEKEVANGLYLKIGFNKRQNSSLYQIKF